MSASETVLPRRNVATNALMDLDIGLPVVAAGVEYVMLDNVYMRAPSFRNGKPTGHRLLAVDMPAASLLQMLSKNMTEEENFSRSARAAINPNLHLRHSTSQMIAQASEAFGLLLGQTISVGPSAGVNLGNVRVNQAVRVKLSRGITFSTEASISEAGSSIDDFSIYGDCYIVKEGESGSVSATIYLGVATRQHGLQLTSTIEGPLTRCKSPRRSRCTGMRMRRCRALHQVRRKG